MKQILTILLIAIAFTSCKNENTSTPETVVEETETPTPEEVPTKTYPTAITAIFNAHGGIDTWNKMNNISFTIPKDVEEVHTVDLKSRKTRIETKDYLLGFDGDKVWLKQDSISFKPERARFYHNLMFYFYAMPFVLGDDGITYSEVPGLEVEGITYPGTKISFGENVGDAPDDNYIVYHDPKTNEMAWLAYTVTYRSGEPSEKYSYIKYADWQDVNGIKLPSTLKWYAAEDGVPTEIRREMTFTKPTATEALLDNKLFDKPEEGTFAETAAAK